MIHLPHGETNVTLACQNRCVSCNHFIPLQDAWFINPLDFARDLAKASQIVHFDVFNLVGGEPTLHPDIVLLLQFIKTSGIADRAEITSNGQSHRKWSDELYQNVDDLIITPYKLADEDIAEITEKCRQFNVNLQWHPVIFTTAAYKQPHTDQYAGQLYRQCWYNRNRQVIDGGYFYRCCTAPFIPQLLLGLPKEHDGITLDGLTEERLNEYLNQPQTPASCTVCASNCGRRIQWSEQADRNQWLAESLG